MRIAENTKKAKTQKCRKTITKKKEENANFAENYVIAEIAEKLNAYPREFSK